MVPAAAPMSSKVAVMVWLPLHLLLSPTAIPPPLSGPATTTSVGFWVLQLRLAVIAGGFDGSFGGELEGAVARQKGMSTASYQSDGLGPGRGPGGGLGCGLGAGGRGPLVQVVHLGSAPIAVIFC